MVINTIMHILEEIPREKLIDVFGYTTPNSREIEAYSDLMWRVSIKYRRNIKRTVLGSRVHGFMLELGYYRILDFQIRHGQIRFTNDSILGVAVISGLEQLLDGSDRSKTFYNV